MCLEFGGCGEEEWLSAYGYAEWTWRRNEQAAKKNYERICKLYFKSEIGINKSTEIIYFLL